MEYLRQEQARRIAFQPIGLGIEHRLSHPPRRCALVALRIVLRARLRDLSCGIALSHFGGKAHSERLLRELVPDYIKLDGSLIERLAKAKDENSRMAMAMLARQAQELKTRVVAAGVSTAPQMASIWQFGVTLVQGTMVAEAGPKLDFDFRQYAG